VGELRSKAGALESDEVRILEERAIGFLSRFFDQSRHGAYSWRDQLNYRGMIRRSPSFDTLRHRPDFQRIVQDLAFPSWPFVDHPPHAESTGQSRETVENPRPAG
jgi:hypothetical protein